MGRARKIEQRNERCSVCPPSPLCTLLAPPDEWRRKNEGLQVTSKESKDLGGGKRLHFMEAIAYGKGVMLKEPYENLNGSFFFIREHLNLQPLLILLEKLSHFTLLSLPTLTPFQC